MGRDKLTNARSVGQLTYSHSSALCLSALGLPSGSALVPGPASMRPGHCSRRAVCADASNGGGHPRPLLDAVQKAHEEDVARELVHGALHQRPALRAAQLAARAHNALETSTAEGVLTGKDLGRGVQALQTYGALKQIQ